jgi:hypothetical protein
MPGNKAVFIKDKIETTNHKLRGTPQLTIMHICVKFKSAALIRYTTEICPLPF